MIPSKYLMRVTQNFTLHSMCSLRDTTAQQRTDRTAKSFDENGHNLLPISEGSRCACKTTDALEEPAATGTHMMQRVGLSLALHECLSRTICQGFWYQLVGDNVSVASIVQQPRLTGNEHKDKGPHRAPMTTLSAPISL
jgi:hypothetical protein